MEWNLAQVDKNLILRPRLLLLPGDCQSPPQLWAASLLDWMPALFCWLALCVSTGAPGSSSSHFYLRRSPTVELLALFVSSTVWGRHLRARKALGGKWPRNITFNLEPAPADVRLYSALSYSCRISASISSSVTIKLSPRDSLRLLSQFRLPLGPPP